MLARNYGEFFSSLFTFLKLGVAGVVLFLLVSKVIDMWKADEAHLNMEKAAQEMLQQKQ
ncbi:MAG: hypothetical protein AAF152_14025 [Cyanobacteria bacterium P01_A01_bin.114]